MNRHDVVVKMAKLADLTQTEAEAALNGLEKVVEDALRAGEDVTLTGFLKFEASERAARTGRNPHTGEPLEIPAAKVVKVTTGSRLKKLFKA